MATTETAPPQDSPTVADRVFTGGYRVVAYFGLMTVFASLLFGFRYDSEARWYAYLVDLFLYASFLAPHLFMTQSWWKTKVWNNPAGSPRERRFYIVFTIVTWLAVLWWHWPLPGFVVNLPEAVRFAGVVGCLWAALLFYEGSNWAVLDGLVAVPGADVQFSHGGETPLLTEGAYAGVRHPMYRAAILFGASAWLVHPNMGQLFWTLMIIGSFIGFIPIEEAQLLAARGEDYLRYTRQVRYRLFRGIW